jgi:hypothetical protein
VFYVRKNSDLLKGLFIGGLIGTWLWEFCMHPKVVRRRVKILPDKADELLGKVQKKNMKKQVERRKTAYETAC